MLASLVSCAECCRYMHLTNYSINKHSSRFVPNSDANADDHGNKWSLSALRRCLARGGIDVASLFARIDALVLKTLIAVELPVVSVAPSALDRGREDLAPIPFAVVVSVA